MMGKDIKAPRLYLPIFFLSRQRVRKYYTPLLHRYIIKHVRGYKIPCFEVKYEDFQNLEKYPDEIKKHFPSKYYLTKAGHRKTSEKTDSLPPNRYVIPTTIGHLKRGIQWSKDESQHKKTKYSLKSQTAFYEISSNYFGKSKNKCNIHKGKFLSNPRVRKPTSRFMVFDPATCYRDPDDPGPADYFLEIFDNYTFPKIYAKPIKPTKYLKNSCVPDVLGLRNNTKTSFSPGPGRYEVLDDEPTLRLALINQLFQRQKFRRLTSQKHKSVLKQNPYGIRHHIFGNGFTRLFKGLQVKRKKIVPKKTTKMENLRMLPSFEYMNKITNPNRKFFSFWLEPLKEKKIALRFNCTVKVQKRRQLRDNKKVVFGSGVPRFTDVDTPVSRFQVETVPVTNFPVMNVNPEKIESKLHKLPERLMGTQRNIRIQPYKFQPIPSVKLLLDEREIQPEPGEVLEIYPRELNPTEYFKFK